VGGGDTVVAGAAAADSYSWKDLAPHGRCPSRLVADAAAAAWMSHAYACSTHWPKPDVSVDHAQGGGLVGGVDATADAVAASSYS